MSNFLYETVQYYLAQCSKARPCPNRGWGSLSLSEKIGGGICWAQVWAVTCPRSIIVEDSRRLVLEPRSRHYSFPAKGSSLEWAQPCSPDVAFRLTSRWQHQVWRVALASEPRGSVLSLPFRGTNKLSRLIVSANRNAAPPWWQWEWMGIGRAGLPCGCHRRE